MRARPKGARAAFTIIGATAFILGILVIFKVVSLEIALGLFMVFYGIKKMFLAKYAS